MQKKRSYFYVLLAGALWGVISLFLKPLLAAGFSQIQTIAGRCLIAAAVLGVYMLIKDKTLFRFRLRDIWCFVGTGILSLLFFSICYFYSMTYNGVCVAVVLLYTSPVFVMLLSALLFKEGGQSVGAFGIFLGVCSGLGYALYSIFSRYALQKNYNSLTVSFYTFLFCGVGCLPFAKPLELVKNLSLSSVLLFIGIGVVCCVLPYLFYTKGLEYVENTRAAVIVAVEPVVASMIGVFVYREEMTFGKLLGILLVLAAVVLCSAAPRKRKKERAGERAGK